MTSFLSEWERKVTVKLEKKHSGLIAIAQTVELLSEWEHKVPVKLEKKHFEPIAMALPVEVTR